MPEQAYWFCGATGCEVVYFGADGATYSVSELRVEVGQKRRSGDAPLCYCYDISYVEAESDPALKRFVIEQTEQKLCSCDSRNPSGRCCLGDFTN